MTDAEAVARDLLEWLACDHEPWRIPEMVERLNRFAARTVAEADRQRAFEKGNRRHPLPLSENT